MEPIYDSDETPGQHEIIIERSGQPGEAAAQLHPRRQTVGSSRDPGRIEPPLGNPHQSRNARPVEPLQRIEQYYDTGARVHNNGHADKRQKRRPDHGGQHAPARLIIEEKNSHSRKPRPHQGRMEGAAKPGAGPDIFILEPRKRRTGRHYATPEETTPCLDQNSNEMLDDYYDGFDDNALPQTTSMGLNHEFGAGYTPLNFQPPPPPPPRPPRPGMFSGSPPPDRIYSRPSQRPGKRYDYIIRAPYSTAIWDRAAVWKDDKYDIKLKLVLTRHGERYSGGTFAYRSGTWTDIVFARKLNQQYHSLKTSEVGIVQKLTAYKKISFVYFIQFHAFPDIRYPRTGAWLRTDRKPISPQDNAMTRNSFMNQLRRMCKKKSILYSTFTGKPNEYDERPPIRWVSRLDELIEAGAVIDIDVKETFDSTKIYMGLFFAIAVSLGAALGYGFAMDNDFSTGFSIASWAITALGFLAAVIAAGEYLGLDSPKATLMDTMEHDRPWR
ncbi:hypothetical protein Slin15195_G105030 [Septoria linicola]|uniref:Uncharacterized protein n=1 Tax=Septoria linicola TaxID=215465 RepID=A0A9Q9AXF7_9PEZI|nr:hypothetical protein Slin15195_G105030 [Septoria linicola]